MLTRPPGGLSGSLGAIGISIGNACAVRSRVADLCFYQLLEVPITLHFITITPWVEGGGECVSDRELDVRENYGKNLINHHAYIKKR